MPSHGRSTTFWIWGQTFSDEESLKRRKSAERCVNRNVLRKHSESRPLPLIIGNNISSTVGARLTTITSELYKAELLNVQRMHMQYKLRTAVRLLVSQPNDYTGAHCIRQRNICRSNGHTLKMFAAGRQENENNSTTLANGCTAN